MDECDKRSREIARKLLDWGTVTDEQTASATDLSLEEIAVLKQELTA